MVDDCAFSWASCCESSLIHKLHVLIEFVSQFIDNLKSRFCNDRGGSRGRWLLRIITGIDNMKFGPPGGFEKGVICD